MNVGELIKFLERYPPNMEVITSRYSDYDIIQESKFSIVTAVPKGQWLMRSHPTMSVENKANLRSYLYLEGN